MSVFTYTDMYFVGNDINNMMFSSGQAVGISGVFGENSNNGIFEVGETLNDNDNSLVVDFKGYTAQGHIIVAADNNFYLVIKNGVANPYLESDLVTFTAGSLPVCFLRGTLILTARGEVPVERLREGDLVATKFGGLRPIRWIGTQSFDGRFAGRATAPIRFARGSLGDGMPSCDLFVSPGHAMLVGEVLAHAGALVNGSTITQERVRGTIEYFHLDLGPHDCVLANGAWAESYFEDRNRDSFHNAAAFHALFPGHVPVRQATCLPIVTAEHPGIAALRALLAPAGLRAAA